MFLFEEQSEFIQPFSLEDRILGVTKHERKQSELLFKARPSLSPLIEAIYLQSVYLFENLTV